jgi:hypothetical protein
MPCIEAIAVAPTESVLGPKIMGMKKVLMVVLCVTLTALAAEPVVHVLPLG